jgi:ABC-2 type transport system permease protein
MSEMAMPLARPRSIARDTTTMIGRGVRLSRRNVEAMITALMLPIMLMLLFVYLFGGALRSEGPYVDYVVPGVILLCAGFGSATTAVTVCQDMRGGIIDRFRSMDVSGVSFLAGHVAASAIRNLVSTALVIGVAFAIGFRSHGSIGQWAAAAAILMLFIVALSWFAAVVGLFAGSPEAAGGFTFFVMFLPYPSSAFVPINTMPSWLQGFARDQPFSPVIDALRQLLSGATINDSAVRSVAWWTGILLVSVVVSAVLFRRKTT